MEVYKHMKQTERKYCKKHPWRSLIRNEYCTDCNVEQNYKYIMKLVRQIEEERYHAKDNSERI